MSKQESNMDAYRHLFQDEESMEKALRGLDLETEPDEGFEDQLKAVYEVERERERSWRASVTPTLGRFLFRAGIVAMLTVVIGLRTIGTAPEPEPPTAMESVNPLAKPWTTIVQMIFVKPAGDMTFETKEQIEFAAFYQTTSFIVETLLWGGLLLMLALIMRDILALLHQRQQRLPT